MSTLRRLIKWMWRAWPVIILIPLICIHLLLLNYFLQSSESINKSISLLTQLFGGLLILYSIDSNIGIIKKQSLLALLASYFKDFPLMKRPTTVEAHASAIAISGGKAKTTVVRNPQSIDEKIQYLQDQINEIRRDFEQEAKELNEKIDRKSKEMGTKIQETNSALRNLESKMNEVSIGGIKPQLFGVLLMVYGAIAGYVA